MKTKARAGYRSNSTTPSRRRHHLRQVPRSVRPLHRHRPIAEAGHYNPCAEFVVSADDCARLPRRLADPALHGAFCDLKTKQEMTELWVETNPRFWRAVVAIAKHCQDGRPAYGGVRYLSLSAGLCHDTFIKYGRIAEQLGIIGIETRPGPGKQHRTNLYRPKVSPVWQVFAKRSDSTFSTKGFNPFVFTPVSQTTPVTEPPLPKTDKSPSVKADLATVPAPDESAVVAFQDAAGHTCHAAVTAELAIWLVWMLSALRWSPRHFLRYVAAHHKIARYDSPEAGWRDVLRRYRDHGPKIVDKSESAPIPEPIDSPAQGGAYQRWRTSGWGGEDRKNSFEQTNLDEEARLQDERVRACVQRSEPDSPAYDYAAALEARGIVPLMFDRWCYQRDRAYRPPRSDAELDARLAEYTAAIAGKTAMANANEPAVECARCGGIGWYLVPTPKGKRQLDGPRSAVCDCEAGRADLARAGLRKSQVDSQGIN